MGGVPWSPKLQVFRDTIWMWSLIIRKLQGRKISARLIFRLKKELNIEDTQCSIEEATNKYKIAMKEHKKVRKTKTVKLRDKFIEKLAEE